MSDASQFKLIIEDDEGRRSVTPLELGEASIGRLDSNTVRLKERNVSRRHARLLRQDASVYVEDLDSYNGLWVNGGRVSGRIELRDGDLVRIGDFQLELQGDGLHPRREDTTQRTMLSQLEAPPPPPVPAPPPLVAAEPTVTHVKPLSPPSPPPAAAAQSPVAAAIEAALLLDDSAVQEVAPEPTSLIRGAAALPEAEAERRAAPLLAGARARLLCVSAQFPGREFEIVKAETILGRTGENDVVLDHRSVSRQHARVVVSKQRFKIYDMDSANGILVNGEPYAQADLKRGDLIELGHVRLRFVPPGETYSPTADELAQMQGPKAASGRPSAAMLAAGGVVLVLAAAAVAAAMRSGSRGEAATAQPALVLPHGGEGSEADKLMAQAHAAIGVRQWKRGQALATAVLALDPGRDEAQAALHLIETEGRAQHSYDAAATAVAASAWSDAWNSLQEVPKESFYYPQAMALMGQVRPALVTERLADCRSAIRNESLDEAELQLEEVEGLDAGRKEIPELRAAIEEGRRRHPSAAGERRPAGKAAAHGKVASSKGRPAAPPPPPPAAAAPGRHPADDPKALYNSAVQALVAQQYGRAIEDLSRCVDTDKNFALCYRALGIAYAKSNNGPKAARYYRMYLKVEPNAADAAKVRQLLQQYESAQ